MTRIWTTFVIAMLLASLIPALANPALAAPADNEEPKAAAEQPLQPLQADADGDGIADDADNCPDVANPGQEDGDGNGVGDACDTAPPPQDTDQDGLPDGQDNCPDVFNPNQEDADGNNIGDACDQGQPVDTDGDLFTDDVDNCPDVNNPGQQDSDGNGIGDACDQARLQAVNGSIQIDYKACPPGTDLNNDGALVACTVAGPSTTFSLTLNGAPAGSQNVPQAPGSALFQELAVGAYLIAQDPAPAGGFAVFCEGFAQSNTKPYARVAFASTAGIPLDLLEGETVRCDWYVLATGVDIYHTKWVCPYGYDWGSNNTREQLMRDCTRPVDNVSFTVQVTSPQQSLLADQTLQADPNQSNTATFMGVPGGSLTMWENLPPEYEFLTVYCTDPNVQLNGAGPDGYVEARLDQSGRLMGEAQSGEIRCDWFNREGPTVVVILKVNCPPDWTPTDSSAPTRLRQECERPAEPVRFEARWNSPTVQQGQEQTLPTLQTDTEGVARTDELAPGGEIFIRELVPDGYQLKYIFCREVPLRDLAREANPSLRAVEATDIAPQYDDVTPQDDSDTLARKLRPGHLIVCIFVDVPDDNGTVIIVKFNCEEGWMPSDGGPSMADLQNCAPPEGPVTFNVRQGETTQTAETLTEEGLARTRALDLPEGELTIQELVPEGYELAYIFCRYIERGPVVLAEQPMTNIVAAQDEPGFEPQTITEAGFTSAIRGGYVLICVFIDVPVNDYDVTVYKWECEPGTLPNQTREYYEGDGADTGPCEVQQSGVPFTLSHGGLDVPFTSDTNGHQEKFIPDENGTFTITEGELEGFGIPFRYCLPLNEPENGNAMPPEWQLGGMGKDITVTVLEGETSYQCWFYNIPAPDYEVTVYKWQCEPGTLPGQPLEYYQGGMPDQDTGPCETSQAPGVPFTLTDANGDTPFFSGDHTGVTLPFVPDTDGNFTITEGNLPGYGEPFRYCLPLNLPENGGAAPAWQTGGMGKDITVTVVDGEYQYQCWFYNIPYENTITLYKWMCPEGTIYGQEQSYYETECVQWHPGVPFTMVDGAGMHEMVTAEGPYTWEDVVVGMEGEIQLIEEIPEEYGDPVVYCRIVGEEDWTTMSSLNGFVIPQPDMVPFDYECYWYNIPWQDSTVTIRKWECPEGAMPDGTPEWYQTNCTTQMNGVDFTLTDSLGPRMLTTAGGQVQWTDVQEGFVSIAETIPPGYDPSPYVVCGWTAMHNGAVIDAFPQPVATINGVLNTTITYPGTEFFCDWYNQYLGDGEITVYKYECPEGYDPYKWGANPMVDCAVALNGVTFVLDQPDPEVNLQSDTGDSINGAVYFGGLAPGNYTISEMVPAEYDWVFVWECVGINTSSVHPKPLSVGPNLAFPIAGGDSIECYWYNVPMPDDGWMIVSKYNCTTATYVSDVNCYTNTTGQAFDLQMWNGANWMTVQSGTTNASGQVTFMNLDPGDYRLVEPGKVACLMKSSNITSGGNIGVAENQQTTVKVYNCSTPQKPPGTPTKYPNTGVEPGSGGSGELRTAHGVELLGMLGLAGTAAVSRRTFLKRAAVGTLAIGGGTVALNGALASQTLVPLDATVTPVGSPAATPFVDCFYPATPSATPEGVLPGTPVACARGAVPMQIRIASIGVDYPIEYLEIIDGEMQQPTGADYITWYKETARLGEKGNGLYAGHLNWWNMPEGPFFLLETLVEGDVVELDGDDGETYRYIVQWTQDFPIDEEPPEEALGQTEDEVITLVTCGGEWDAEVALYDHRTVVRAIRDRDFVPGTPAPGA